MHSGVVVKAPTPATGASLAVKEAKAAPGGLTQAGGLTFAYAQVASKFQRADIWTCLPLGISLVCVCMCVCTCVHMHACMHVQCV